MNMYTIKLIKTDGSKGYETTFDYDKAKTLAVFATGSIRGSMAVITSTEEDDVYDVYYGGKPF